MSERDTEITDPDEHGVVYAENDNGRYALGLNPDVIPLEFRAYTSARTVKSRSELIDRANAETREFGVKRFGRELTKDQNGHGKCASSAGTYAVEKARIMSGQKHVELADDYLYSLVNDGQDRGSTLSENMEAISSRGIARRSLVGHGDIYRNRYNTAPADQDALRFRAHEAFVVNSEEEMASAIDDYCCVVIAIHVGRNWQRFDKDGVLIGDRGPGNHSEHLDDYRYNREKERFEFRKHSSHGTQYGDGGFCWITYEHVRTVHESHRKYAVPTAIQDPMADDWSPSPTPTPEPDAPKLTVRSSEFCHWCKKWDQNDRARVKEAGIQIAPGEVPGSGVPRFTLTVGGQSKTKVGYWSAGQIIKAASDMKLSELVG